MVRLTVIFSLFFVLFGATVLGSQPGDTFVSREFGCSFTMPDTGWQRAEGLSVVTGGLVEYLHRDSLANFAFFATDRVRPSHVVMEETKSIILSSAWGLKVLEHEPMVFEGLEGELQRFHFVNTHGLAYDAVVVILNGENVQFGFHMFTLSSSYEDARSLLQAIMRTFSIE